MASALATRLKHETLFFLRPATEVAEGPGHPHSVSRARVSWRRCTAHAPHDGYIDMIYALLPLWQADFRLGYGTLAILRGVYAGTMVTFQLPDAWRNAQRHIVRSLWNGAGTDLDSIESATRRYSCDSGHGTSHR
jgi:hypothetical protein